MCRRELQVLLYVLASICLLFAGAAMAQPALSNLTQILSATPESSWVKVNLNPYSAAWVSPDLQVLPYVGDSKPGSILAAWSSFAWDSNRGDLILWGGGHANYGGNEVYRWRGPTQLWERASVPSEVELLTGVTYEAIDGALNAPVAAHTYDNQVFLKQLDRFLTFGGASFDTGAAQPILLNDGTIRPTGPFVWDPSRGDPNKVGGTTGSHVQRVAPHPEIVGGHMWQDLDIYDGRFPVSSLPSTFVMGVSDVTVDNGVETVYITGRIGGGTDQDLFRLRIPDLNDRSLDTWDRVGIWWSGSSSQGAGAFDPTRKIFLRTGDGGLYFSYWNLNSAGPTNRDVPVTSIIDPTGQFSMNVNFGMDFDPVQSNFVLWNGGATIWRATPPAGLGSSGWIISREPAPVGAVPPSAVGTGVLGKFKYIMNLNAFMALDVNGDVWLYKPVGWSNPDTGQPPVVSLTSPANGASYVAPTSVVVSANASDVDGSVTRVDFYAGGALIGSASSAPYSVTWSNVAAGSYSLTAKAVDNAGASTTSAAVSITVTAPANVAPSVSITAPVGGTHFAAGSAIAVTAAASDSDGSIASVMLYADGVVFASLSGASPPYAATLTGLAAGVHALTAQATDNGGASTTSAGVSITVDPAAGSGTVTLQDVSGGYGGTRDTYLDSYNPGYAWGTANQMLEYGNNYADLVRFAVFVSEGGPVPNGATITSATLSLYKQGAYDQSYQLRRVLKDWVEVEATWNKARASTPWAVAGANGVGSDIATGIEATGSVGWNPGWLNFDVTAGLSAMSTGTANYGWKLQPVSGTLA
ncbi:MAG: Ig-like domain-containing protein, partial [Casimicrobiaceae bacterium]